MHCVKFSMARYRVMLFFCKLINIESYGEIATSILFSSSSSKL